MGKGGLGHNSMTLVAGLVVVPHLTDVILRALLGRVPSGASTIGPNSMDPLRGSQWWCLIVWA